LDGEAVVPYNELGSFTTYMDFFNPWCGLKFGSRKHQIVLEVLSDGCSGAFLIKTGYTMCIAHDCCTWEIFLSFLSFASKNDKARQGIWAWIA
jgi:hypothetical protein